MEEREPARRGPAPAAVDCPECGGAVRREGLSVEEDRAACPFCGRELDLSASAAGVRGAAVAGPPPEDLSCPKCGAAVTEASVEYLDALARCGHCTTVLDLSSGRNADWYRRRMEAKEGVPLPRTFRVTRRLGIVTIEWLALRHRLGHYTRLPGSGGLLRRVLLTAVAFLVVASVACLFVPDPALPWFAGIGWAVLALPLVPMLILRRTVAVSDGSVLVGWGPFGRWTRIVPAAELRQLFVIYRDLDFPDGVDHPAVSKLLGFDLMAVGRDGDRFRLLGPFAERGEALFLERWIERRLGIPERHVDGEMLLEGPGPHG
jgi:endogenous inhibitor of DNA gyrase (YacG/DUF329 family)